jgi:serine/threonine protein kinase
MYNVPRGHAFARKLIRVPQVDAKLIDNEIQMLKALSTERHHHIVAVFRIGMLRNSQDLFIDMELCDLNLREYIRGTKSRHSVPVFFVRDQPPPMLVRQIWNVMIQITNGVEYLHSQKVVHRDLKPANGTVCPQIPLMLVLYSRKDGVWKLADCHELRFAISCHSA